MSLAQGDADLLLALFAYRYATSGQLARRSVRSTPVIRRAIRQRLKPEGFVVTLQRDPTEEAAYTLGPEGLAFIAHELKCPVSDLPFPKTSTSRSFFWKHSMLITDIRISFDLATKDPASPVCIERTIGEWEVNPAARGNSPLIFERFKGPDGATCFHRPDGLFLMRPRAAGADQRVAVFLEADRNSEAIQSRIRAKYEGCYQYWIRRRFFDAFQAVAMRVLFVLDNVTDRRRICSMQEELRCFAESKGASAEQFRRCFRFALQRDLTETTILAHPVWRDADDQPRLFFLQPVPQPPRTSAAEVSA